jgi:hypothetical protein
VDRRRHAVIPGLAGARHGFIKLGDPAAILLIGLVLDALSDCVKLKGIVGPAKSVADEPKDRIPRPRPDRDDHHARQQLLFDRKRDHGRVKMTE